MRKKISAKIFILLASALLVAHAVIPHLHYKNEVFIITPACSLDEDHKHNAPEHNDSCESRQHFCILNQVVLIRPDDVKTEIVSPSTDKSNFENTPFYIVSTAVVHQNTTEQKKSPPVIHKSSLYLRLGDCALSPRGSPMV